MVECRPRDVHRLALQGRDRVLFDVTLLEGPTQAGHDAAEVVATRRDGDFVLCSPLFDVEGKKFRNLEVRILVHETL